MCDIETIAKTLIDGDFVEIYWKESPEIPRFFKVFGITKTQIGYYWDIYSDGHSDYYIPFNDISRLIIRKDLKEAYEKFRSLLTPNL